MLAITAETGLFQSYSIVRRTNKVHLLSYTMMNNNHIFHYTELDLIVTGQNKTKKKKDYHVCLGDKKVTYPIRNREVKAKVTIN